MRAKTQIKPTLLSRIDLVDKLNEVIIKKRGVRRYLPGACKRDQRLYGAAHGTKAKAKAHRAKLGFLSETATIGACLRVGEGPPRGLVAEKQAHAPPQKTIPLSSFM